MSVRCLFIAILLSSASSSLCAGDAAATSPAEGAARGDAVSTPTAEARKEEDKSGKKDADEKEQEREIVVTAAQLPTARETTGVSISTITDQDLRINQDTHAAEALRMVPGVTVNQTGRKGDQATLFVRGGNSNHTMVLVDGWKVNRFGGGRFYNFEALDPIGAQRIEIARGPGSALFGSEAVTGTVHLISRKGEGRPLLTASAAAGTYRTDRETLAIEGREGKFSYNAAAARLYRGEASVMNSELETYNWNARFDYDIDADHALKLVTRGMDFSKGWYEHTATGFGTAVDRPDPNDRIHNEDRLVGLEYAGRPVPIWETIVRLGHYSLDLENYCVEPNPVFPPWFNWSNEASHQLTHERRNSVEWRNHVTVYRDEHIRGVVTLGAYGEGEYFKEHDSSTFYASNFRRHHINYAGYAQGRLELFDRAFITLDGRHEETEEFGSHDTGRADVSIVVPESDTRVFGSVGTAFRAPTFFELFSSFSGNPNLKPETNFAYDVGIEQRFWDRRIALSATWFENNFTDLITFEYVFPNFRSVNAGTAQTRGFELEGRIRPLRHLELQGSATLLHTRDDEGRRLARRPPRTYTGRLLVHPLLDLVPEKWSGLDLSFEVLSVSTRTDTGLDPATGFYGSTRNGGYCRGDIAVSYRFLEHFRAFARFENITDTKYQDILTFPADGANALGGLEFNWRF